MPTSPADAARDTELRDALADARRAVGNVLEREDIHVSDPVGLLIEQVYTGRFDMRPRNTAPEYCPTHPSIRNPCGLCPPPPPPGDDDDD